MKRLIVNAKTKKYSVAFYNSFENLLKEIKDLNTDFSKIVIITDDLVDKIYTQIIEDIIKQAYPEIYTFVFNHGEKNKHLDTISEAYSFMLSKKLDRKSLVVALGGGVVGDMAGYAAATYMRGIKFIQIPTTLLSQVDSSVGGKTGVDFKGYKNIIGSFYQPELVYINTQTLKTLPKNQFSSGMAEVIKHGLIMDKDYFNEIEKKVIKIKELDDDVIASLIYKSCSIKSEIVSEDEMEEGKRALLNFGHTIGHAIEKIKDFKLLHGECVSLGIIVALYISKELNYIGDNIIIRVEELLKSFNLPTFVSDINSEEIYSELFHDKKTMDNQINYILLKDIGNSFISNKVSREIVLNAIEKIIR